MVDLRLIPLRNRTFHIDNELTADIFRDIQGYLGYFRIKDDLNGTAAVTQIDENQSAQIASSLNPAGQMDRFVYAFPYYFGYKYSCHYYSSRYFTSSSS